MSDALDTIIGDLRAYIAQLRAQLAQAEQRALAAEVVPNLQHPPMLNLRSIDTCR